MVQGGPLGAGAGLLLVCCGKERFVACQESTAGLWECARTGAVESGVKTTTDCTKVYSSSAQQEPSSLGK